MLPRLSKHQQTQHYKNGAKLCLQNIIITLQLALEGYLRPSKCLEFSVLNEHAHHMQSNSEFAAPGNESEQQSSTQLNNMKIYFNMLYYEVHFL